MGNSLSDHRRAELFGHIEFRPTSGGQVYMYDRWEDLNIVTVYVPQLDGVMTDSGPFSGRVRWNRRAVEQLQHAWADAAEKGLMGWVRTWDGSFNPRLIRGSTTRLSNHAYGTAFDINAEWNEFRHQPAGPGETGDVHPLVETFKDHGFLWGGDWAGADGMHFEVGSLQDYSDLEEVKVIASDDWRDAIVAKVRDGVSYAMGTVLAAMVGEEWHGADHEVAVAPYLRAHGFVVRWNEEQQKIYAYRA